MSRRVIVILFDASSLVLCFLIHNFDNSFFIGFLSSVMSIAMFTPVMLFVIKNKLNIVSKVQKNIFKVLGFILEFISEIPIIGFIMVIAPLAFYGITIGIIHDKTGYSFFGYMVLVAICLRLIFETIWHIISNKRKKRTIQIN